MKRIRQCFEMLDPQGRRRLVVIAALILFSTLMEVTVVGLVFPLIAIVNKPELIDQKHVLQVAYRMSGAASPTEFLEAFGIALFTLILFKNGYFYLVTQWQSRFAYGQMTKFGARLLGRYLAAPYEVHLRRNSADMITRVDTFVERVMTTQVLLPSIMLVTESCAVIAIIALLLAVEPKLTLVAGVVLGGSALVLATFQRRVLGDLSGEIATFSVARLKSVQQSLGSIKEVKALGHERFFLDEFERLQGAFARAHSRVYTMNQIPRPVLETVAFGGVVLILVLILMQGRATADAIGILALFLMAASRILPGISRIIYAYYAIVNGGAMIEALRADMTDPELGPGLPDGEATPMRFARAIELKDVSFAYRGTPRPVVEEVSLTVNRGEAVGLVGASGAGKSTIVDILLGLLAPQKGAVLVDGADISANPRPWRRIVGYVPQAISLIDDSLRNNVAFGVGRDRIDDARVWEVLRLAHLDEFVRSLPEGLDIVLGERGVRLSGGQRQRVGIARALYHDPEVLVLDEATSALDNQSERDISEALDALRGEKTLVIIAHRLSTVKRCDRLVLMRDGRVADSGKFADLVARDEEFHEMVRLAELAGGKAEPQTALI